MYIIFNRCTESSAVRPLLIRSFYSVREIFLDFIWIEKRYQSTGSLRAFSLLPGYILGMNAKQMSVERDRERDCERDCERVRMKHMHSHGKEGQRSFPVPAWSGAYGLLILPIPP